MLTLTGTLLAGKYRVGARLGGGGMGEVYEAVQEDLGRRVAIKVMSGPMANEPSLLERFQREARAVAALGHPHIVQVTDFQDNPGEPPFFVMERLVGESLGELHRARAGPIDPDARRAHRRADALRAGRRARGGPRPPRREAGQHLPLPHGHRRRSREAARLRRREGAGGAGGRAASRGPAPSSARSSYMAPEQARGDALDARADLYALGACMYHALTGRPPYDAPTAARLLAAVAGSEPAPLNLLRPGLPPALRAVVVTAMARNPDARFASARSMLAQVSAWLRGDSTVLASGPVTGGQVAVRVNATGAPTPFSAPPPSPYAAQSGPPPPPPWGTPPPVVHPSAGLAPATHQAPRRSPVLVLLAAVLALVGVASLATAGLLVFRFGRGAAPVIAVSSTGAYSVSAPGAAAPSETSATVAASVASVVPSASASQTPTLAVSSVAPPPVPRPAFVAPPPIATGSGAPSTGDTAKLMGAIAQAHSSGDGRACLDAFDKLEKSDPAYPDSGGGYRYMKGDCMMMAGRCDDGRKQLRSYWTDVPRPATQKMGPVEVENAVSGAAQMYCPPAQLTPTERVRRAQILVSKAQTNHDSAAIGKHADEMAAAVNQLPMTTDEERRQVNGYHAYLAGAYGSGGQCPQARAQATQACAISNPKVIDACADGILSNTVCKKTATP